MIAGIEGIHTVEGGVTLNNRSAWPYYDVERMTGFAATADFDPTSDPAIGRPGEIPRFSERTGKTTTIEGTVKARTALELDQGVAALVSSFAANTEIKITSKPHASWVESPIAERFWFARPLECAVEESQEVGPNRPTLGHERAFSVTLRLSRPRFFYPDEVEENSAELEELSGTGLPLKFPAQVAPQSNLGVELTVDNTGTSDADALLLIYGGLSNPIVSNETTGKFLRFRNQIVLPNQGVAIDFARRNTYLVDEEGEPTGAPSSIRGKLDARSTWWDRGERCLLPGENVIRLRGYQVASADFTVRFRPSDLA